MKKKGKWRFALVALAAGVVIGGVALLTAKKEAKSPTVSVGISRLAEERYMAVSAAVGESIIFDAATFDAALGGAPVSALKITRLPDPTVGELQLGHAEVSASQIVRRENLSYLRFEPTEAGGETSFSFMPVTEAGEMGYEISCALRFFAGENGAPTVKGQSTATHAGLVKTGVLSASDADGDALYFEVVSYPTGGTLSLDAGSGAFTYTPSGDFVGEDGFVFRVTDEYGNASEEARTTISVRALETGYYFEDMQGNDAHSAALFVTGEGLLTGEMISGKHYFHPDRTLTRAAFVAVLLRAAEVQAPEASDTGFTDDAEIPAPMKGAIRYAREQGWLGEDSVFRPNEAITRAEAAEIAARVLGLAKPSYGETVRDHDSIPTASVDALYAAFEGGYLDVMADGTLAHGKALTRAEAAILLEAAMS